MLRLKSAVFPKGSIVRSRFFRVSPEFIGALCLPGLASPDFLLEGSVHIPWNAANSRPMKLSNEPG